MTDFLTRLAERTLGTAPTARPVLAPLFASPAAVDQTEHAATHHVASPPESEAAGAAIATQPRRIARVANEIAVVAPDDEVRAEVPGPARRSHETIEPGENYPLVGRATPSEISTSRATEADHESDTRGLPSERSQPQPIEVVNSTHMNDLESAQSHDDQPSISENAINTAHNGSRSNRLQPLPPKDLPTLTAAPVRRGASQDRSELPTSVSPPRAWSTGKQPTEAATLQEREEAVPVIRVSIGRIEVRALSAPAPPPQPTPVTPRLSLDEYLRGLNGNGR